MEDSSSDKTFQERISRLLRLRGGSMDVGSLYLELRRDNLDLSATDFSKKIKRLLAEGVIQEDSNLENLSLSGYFALWELNADLYISVVACLSATIAVYTIPQSSLFHPVRVILSLIFVLIIPGYVIIQAIFRERNELGAVLRFALSAGVSSAVVASIGLVLNYTPWRLTISSILTSVDTLVVALCILVFVRRYRTYLRRNRKIGSVDPEATVQSVQ